MRRVTATLAAAGIAAALAVSATACGASSTQSSSGSSSSGSAKGSMKVGIAYDVGGRGDHSFNDSAARGLDQATKEFGGTPKELTAKTTDTESDREQRLSDLASAGYNPVVAVGFAYANAVQAVSAKFPKTNFGIVDSVVQGSNVDSMTFASPESSYLAGVAAALKSKSGQIGFIGGVDNQLIKGFQAGFQQGVTDTKPNDKVTTQYLTTGSDLSGFSSPDLGKSAASGMLSKGIDVIYTAAGSSGSGAIEAVHGQKGAWAIGVDSDQYQDKGLAQYKDSILTSAVKNVDVAVLDFIKSVHDGKALTGNNTYGLNNGGVSLATSGGFITDIQSQLDAVKQKIVSGQIKVKSTP